MHIISQRVLLKRKLLAEKDTASLLCLPAKNVEPGSHNGETSDKPQ